MNKCDGSHTLSSWKTLFAQFFDRTETNKRGSLIICEFILLQHQTSIVGFAYKFCLFFVRNFGLKRQIKIGIIGTVVEQLTNRSSEYPMKITPINKINIADEVYDQLLSMILSGAYEIDAKIPSENALCEEFNVSRHTIRTVLNRFYAMGLIETIPGDGTYLRSPSGSLFSKSIIPIVAFQENSVFDVMEYRIALETESARLCASRISESGLLALKKEIAQLEAFAEDSPEEFAYHDIDFHVMIAENCGNPIIVESMKVVQAVQNAKISDYITRTDNIYSQREHRGILQAIESGDSALAAEKMYIHLSNVIDRFHTV